MKKIIFILPFLGLALVGGAYLYRQTASNPLKKLHNPELSGWIAWWNESNAYKTLESRKQFFHTVSPYWFDVNKSFTLQNVSSTTDRETLIKKFAKENIEIIPLVNTGLSLHTLSPVFQKKQSGPLIQQILLELTAYNAKAVDIDFEEVAAEDKQQYVSFLTDLKQQLTSHNIKLVVSVLAQTGDSATDGEGTAGVDLEQIGKLADQVNVLAYDLHGDGTEAGPITTLPWLKAVIMYTKSLIPKEKIVIGLPMYGYVWQLQNTSPGAYPYDEFMLHMAADKKFTFVRDADSAELHYVASGQDAWVSDYESVAAYITASQELGLNRFSIWHIGGMDERLFE